MKCFENFFLPDQETMGVVFFDNTPVSHRVTNFLGTNLSEISGSCNFHQM